jgi:rare lipoprotein A
MIKACLILSSLVLLLSACGPKHRLVVEKGLPPRKPPIEWETVKRDGIEWEAMKRDRIIGEAKKEKGLPERLPEEIERRETRSVQYGIASWYGPDFHGKPTSSGEIYDMFQLTCAHNQFPLGTTVIVTNLENGMSLELKVNDRGPFVKERIIDVSYSAARILGLWEKGTALVRVEGLGPLIEEIQRYTLQVGSFTEEARAQKLADQLRRNFQDVHITTVETSTQKYHRVRIGQFETKEPAVALAEQLSQMGYKVLVTNR